MEFLGILLVPLTLLMVVVAPIWIIAHYLTRWRSTKAFSAEDEARFARLQALAERLDRRLDSIERILDAEPTPHADRTEKGDRR